MSLNGKVVLITGASSGIGAGTAVAFAKLGANVAIVGRAEDKLNATKEACKKAAKNVQVLVIAADVTKDAARIIEKTMEKFGRLDVLVNNAGILGYGSILEADLQQFDEIFNTNLRAVFQLTKLAAPHLIATKGNIVNVSSLAGLRSFPGALNYCMSKSALDQFTHCTALDLAPQGVRVNAVNPAVIITDIHLRTGMSAKAYAAYLEQCKKTHALGRAGEVREVADTITFLAGEGASFITGTCIPVDGGKNSMCPHQHDFDK